MQDKQKREKSQIECLIAWRKWITAEKAENRLTPLPLRPGYSTQELNSEYS